MVIQIATLKWIVPNITALRKTLGSKNMEQKGRIKKSLFIIIHSYCALFIFTIFVMKHTCTLSARIKKHLYVSRRAQCEKYYNA